MKRVKAGCILQTLVFSQKSELGLSKETALQMNRKEIEHYKAMLERARVRYQIDGEDVQADGTVIVHVRKQYNAVADVSEYFC